MAINIEKIQLKRADDKATVIAASLDRGEPAIALNNRELWVGDGTGNIKISDLVVVNNHASLPTTGEADKLYLVVTDESVDNETTLYVHKGGVYVLVTCGTGTLVPGDITDLGTYIDDRITNNWRGQVDGVAPLDSGSQIPSSYLPPLSLTDVHVVADNTARDALTVQEGDIAIVGDPAVTYIRGDSAWIEMGTAPDGVMTVNGHTGPTVVLITTDIAEGTNLYFTDARAIAAVINDSAATTTTDKAWSINKTNLEIEASKDYLGDVSIDDTAIADGKSIIYNATSGNLEYHAVTINGGEL